MSRQLVKRRKPESESSADGPPSKILKVSSEQTHQPDIISVLDRVLDNWFLDSKELLKFAFCTAKSVKASILTCLEPPVEEELWKKLCYMHWGKETASQLMGALEPMTPKDCYRKLVLRQENLREVRPLKFSPKDYAIIVNMQGFPAFPKVLKGEDMPELFGRGGKFMAGYNDPLFVAHHFYDEDEIATISVPASIDIQIVRIPDQRVLRFTLDNNPREKHFFGMKTLSTELHETQDVDVFDHRAPFPPDHYATELTRIAFDNVVPEDEYFDGSPPKDFFGDECRMQMVFQPEMVRKNSEGKFVCYGFSLLFMLGDYELSEEDPVTYAHFLEAVMS